MNCKVSRRFILPDRSNLKGVLLLSLFQTFSSYFLYYISLYGIYFSHGIYALVPFDHIPSRKQHIHLQLPDTCVRNAALRHLPSRKCADAGQSDRPDLRMSGHFHRELHRNEAGQAGRQTIERPLHHGACFPFAA